MRISTRSKRERWVLRLLLSALAWVTTVVPASAASSPTPVVLPYSVRWDMHSAITGRDYRISVYTPAGPAPKTGLPLLLVTDADVFFPLAVGQMLIRSPGEIRPALIVGISYPTIEVRKITRLRTWDLTPSSPTEVPAGLKQLDFHLSDMGGGERFYHFITEELQPALAKRYKLDPSQRTLFGHSFGGLFTLHVLLNHPGSFQNYVAASPSIMWNGGAILKDVPGFRSAVTTNRSPPRVLLTVGGEEASAESVPLGPTPLADVAKMVKEYDAVENVGKLAGVLRTVPGVEVETTVFPNENHVSVQPASLARALSFALAQPTYGKPCPWPCRAGSTAQP